MFLRCNFFLSDPGKGHAKFTNYSFDVAEFARIIAVASEKVKNHEDFVRIRNQPQPKEEL